MRKTLAFLALGLLSTVLGQSVESILNAVQENLEKSPWEARLVGRIQAQDGSLQPVEVLLRAVLAGERVLRLEFKKPPSLEGNFVVVTEKEVWNYLYLTNQLVIQPRAKARIEGLNANLTFLGDFRELAAKVQLRLDGEGTSEEGPVWRLAGRPREGGLGFTQAEILVLKADPRPVALTLRDTAGNPVAELRLLDFRRSRLSPAQLKRYPQDAQVVRR